MVRFLRWRRNVAWQGWLICDSLNPWYKVTKKINSSQYSTKIIEIKCFIYKINILIISNIVSCSKRVSCHKWHEMLKVGDLEINANFENVILEYCLEMVDGLRQADRRGIRSELYYSKWVPKNGCESGGISHLFRKLFMVSYFYDANCLEYTYSSVKSRTCVEITLCVSSLKYFLILRRKSQSGS